MKKLEKILGWFMALLTLVVVGMFLYMLLYNSQDGDQIVAIFKPLFIFWGVTAVTFIFLLMHNN